MLEASLDGYLVYHGTRSGDYTEVAWAGKSTSLDWVVTSSGGHYFAVTAVDVSGAESARSAEVSVSVP